ncbi:MAG: fumarate reductase cytochrome b subunit [Sulfurimonas sp.]|nr:fumarate reductase cytochrome b subunit [Sulfurimonas sp.]MBU3939198.1 fumarate reductase cytochrome b subunit [bacterium]MBU4023710.1 fumarate reductase cytochrome b subunit [bacterium]MBU4058807.1 fumarate reductase cytochrome b subunit [bacterium]MBU4111538.1 fumarate reductase cytochrome b subunit [bacterium]
MKKKKIDKTPARLDFIQSASGLILGLFMWGHMFFVSTILLGKDVMYNVTRFFEGYYFFGESYPIIVTIVAGIVFFIFIVHAAVAIRKFPSSYKQYKIMRNHIKSFKHDDTRLWFWQVFTGFAMFFLGSVHLYIIMTNSADIGPYASADRVVSEWMWPLYILLLLAVEFHGSIGMYRLALKWGWFEGKDAKKTRDRLRSYKYAITVFFLTLGFLTLAAYIKIGIEHKDNVGERYHEQSVTVKGVQQ